MKNIHDVLVERTNLLARLQAEVEALRTAARLLGNQEESVSSSSKMKKRKGPGKADPGEPAAQEQVNRFP